MITNFRIQKIIRHHLKSRSMAKNSCRNNQQIKIKVEKSRKYFSLFLIKTFFNKKKVSKPVSDHLAWVFSQTQSLNFLEFFNTSVIMW